MDNNIERFIRDNREAFDGQEPSPRLWDNIEKQIGLVPQKETPVRKISWRIMLAAASVVLILASAIIYFNRPSGKDPSMAVTEPRKDEIPSPSVEPSKKASDTPAIDNEATVDEQIASVPRTPRTDEDEIAAIDPSYAKRAAYLTDMIDRKASELKVLEKENPQLYKTFVKDIDKLDSTYSLLKNQLPVNPNKEELLQAMIQNLQIQIDLLNQQLSIIKKIKQAKQKENEKANTVI